MIAQAERDEWFCKTRLSGGWPNPAWHVENQTGDSAYWFGQGKVQKEQEKVDRAGRVVAMFTNGCGRRRAEIGGGAWAEAFPDDAGATAKEGAGGSLKVITGSMEGRCLTPRSRKRPDGFAEQFAGGALCGDTSGRT